MVKELARRGFDINSFSHNDDSFPLFDAVQKGDEKLVQACLDSGAQPHMRNKKGESAFSLVGELYKNNRENLSFLRKSGVSSKVIAQRTEIIETCEQINAHLRSSGPPVENYQMVRSTASYQLADDAKSPVQNQYAARTQDARELVVSDEDFCIIF